MADKPESGLPDFTWEIVLFLVGLFLFSFAIYRIEYFLSLSYIESWWGSFVAWLSYYLVPFLKLVSVLSSSAMLVGIVYVVRKLTALNVAEREVYGGGVSSTAMGEKVTPKNEKWERVVEHINSPNSSDWRLAIIEADVMLDELLRTSGYHGDSIGDMLKAVEPSDMLTLDAAWEAHKIRNRIAHEGSDFHLNEREAKHAVALFEKVFKEFQII